MNAGENQYSSAVQEEPFVVRVVHVVSSIKRSWQDRHYGHIIFLLLYWLFYSRWTHVQGWSFHQYRIFDAELGSENVSGYPATGFFDSVSWWDVNYELHIDRHTNIPELYACDKLPFCLKWFIFGGPRPVTCASVVTNYLARQTVLDENKHEQQTTADSWRTLVTPRQVKKFLDKHYPHTTLRMSD